MADVMSRRWERVTLDELSRRFRDVDVDDIGRAARRISIERLGTADRAVILVARCDEKWHLLAEVEAARDERGVTFWVRWPKVWGGFGDTLVEVSEPLTYSGTSRWAACKCDAGSRRLVSHMVLVEALGASVGELLL